MMTRSLRCVLTEVRDLPTYDGISEVDTFLNKFEREVLKKQRFQALNWVLCATPARWWGTHKGSFDDWRECRRMIRTRFGKPRVRLTDKYNGQDNPCAHLARWMPTYGKQPMQMRMNSVMGDTVNKHVLGSKMHQWLLKWE